ncbi:conserved hypothetical protein [Treponema primitia ZAS-2]|uniref:GerMN domain-containing protein n=1 Tax=Treponema primitia (strain ATCC BAA-887 / DSM 12427 / ZAS-2) TaxID=545694 RepID=F5YMR4_TREPZ|nr:GerMN domain-containing protein [Treponema primitia]AEF86458.1 conserved hypothetical protein [Treponema primitia ZAS-2]
MAALKNRNKNTSPPPKKTIQFVFWTLFFIVIISLFIVSWQLIESNVKKTGLLDRLFNREAARTESPSEIPVPLEIGPGVPSPGQAEDGLPIGPTEPAPEPADEFTLTGDEAPEPQSLTETKPAAPPVTPAPPAVQSRDRALYFIRVDGDGTILRTSVNRTVTLSDSPLEDVLRLLLQGPTAAEKARGLITLIPPGTKFLRAEVRGSTVYISFSEDFQFNTYGVEGYVGQLRQVVWTATEFSNVKDVQILIEGRRVDYLGEGINIGSPLDRDAF